MKFISYDIWLNETQKEGVIVLLPGSFKPMHASHADLIRRYSEHPDVKEVKVLIGPGIRNGIDQNHAMKIAHLLLKDFHNVSIEAVKYPSPVLTAYKYIETAKPGIYAMGGVNKNGDYNRVLKFVNDHKPDGKYFHTKPEGVTVIELEIDTKPLYYKGRTDEYEGEPISASILRNDILQDDYNNFRTNYPGYDEKTINKIWEMTQIVIKESVNEKFILDSDLIKDMGIGIFVKHNFKSQQKILDFVYTNLGTILRTSNIPEDIICTFGNGFLKQNYFNEILKYIERYIKLNGKPYPHDANFFNALHNALMKKGFKTGADSWRYSDPVYKDDHSLMIKESLLLEGGNIFDDTSSIKKEYIEPTVKKFKETINKVFPKVKFDYELLGSAGKKDVSGDIDLGVNEDVLLNKDGSVKNKDWNISDEEFINAYEAARKRARTSSEKQTKINVMNKLISHKLVAAGVLSDPKKSTTSIFCAFPQYDEKGKKTNKYVQIDTNIGPMNWLKFSYYSEVYKDNVKGLHRTQLLVALFANKKRMFRHGSGVFNPKTQVYDAANPEEAIDLLNKLYKFKKPLDDVIIKNFFTLYDFLIENLNTQELYKVYDIYLKILDSTRTDVPNMLQDYWIENQERLGLQGKFLPEDSNLIKYTK